MPRLCKAREMLLAVVSLSAQESLTWPLTCLALSVAKVEAFSGISGGRLQHDVLCPAPSLNMTVSAFFAYLVTIFMSPAKGFPD